MLRPALPVLLGMLLAASAGGCGRAGGVDGGAAPDSALAFPSPYDGGPRAGEAPVAPVLAAKGAGLFKTKGCSVCHAFGVRLTCPDLMGVTTRRTADWMERQILHPEIMLKEDPIAQQLVVDYVAKMPNQGLTPGEARMVIEYAKLRDRELGVLP